MNIKLLALALCLAVASCTSPVKDHNKDVQRKANKLQNVQSGPLSSTKDTSGVSVDSNTASRQ